MGRRNEFLSVESEAFKRGTPAVAKAMAGGRKHPEGVSISSPREGSGRRDCWARIARM